MLPYFCMCVLWSPWFLTSLCPPDIMSSHLLWAHLYLLFSAECDVCWGLLTSILGLHYPLLIHCSSVLCLALASGSLIHVNIHLALCITSFIYFFSHVDQSSYYNYRIQCYSLNGQILKLLFLCQLILVKKNENIE